MTLDEAIRIARAAEEDGEHKDAARLWSKAVELVPDNVSLLVHLIMAHFRAREADEADDVAWRGVERNRSDPRFVVEWCRVADTKCDWGQAIRRWQHLRAEFPNEPEMVALSYDGESHALVELAEFSAARIILDEAWSIVAGATSLNLSKLSDRLEHLGEYQKCKELLDGATASNPASGVSPEYLATARQRVSEALANREWLQQYAPGLRVLSVGQNCLPFQLPLRWGLREPPDELCLTPFDLGGHIANTASDIINSDFVHYVADEDLAFSSDGRGIQVVFQKRYRFGFFHERGPTWLADGTARVKAAYHRRIENFRRQMAEDPCVFFFCLCGSGAIEYIVESFKPFMGGRNAVMLIVNVLQADEVTQPSVDWVIYRHIPYPRDYNWSGPADVNSGRGLAFESSVADALKDAIRHAVHRRRM